MITDKELRQINGRALRLIQQDRRWQWRETINIAGYSVFEYGVNEVPRLIKEIRRLKKELADAKTINRNGL